MGLYYQFQTALIFAKFVPFIQIRVYIPETIIPNSCLEEFNQDHFNLK